MTISYIKKANKTASSDEVETRQKVQEVLNEIESKRDEGIKDISRKFDKYEGDVIVTQEKIEEVIKSLDQKVKDDVAVLL
jgi:sulfopropanediol 3-dehydrogenase